MSRIDIAFITPISALNQYASLSNIHMSLAHLVLDNDEYATYYKGRKKFVIMDNSAFEFEKQGMGVPQDMIIKASQKIVPDEICVTDVLFKGEDTVHAVKDFMAFVKKQHPSLIDSVQFMAIPQGRTEDEWLSCYEQLVIQDDIQTIGLSKLSVPESFVGNHHKHLNCTVGRKRCIQTLVDHKMEPYRWNKRTHLLGSDNGGVSELRHYYNSGYNEWIRSNDTSMPFVYGSNHSVINDASGLASDIIMEKLDFNSEFNSEDQKYTDLNFLIWRTINV